MTPTWIAEERVVFVQPDGTRVAGRIAVGLPTQAPENAWCPVVLDGMERSTRIGGETTLQALLLAVSFLGMRLHDFLSRGGRVLYPAKGAGEAETGDLDFALDALFGPLLREPELRPLDDEA